MTYGTTEEFLVHFGLRQSIKDLPGLAELKGAGLLENNLPPKLARARAHRRLRTDGR